MSFLRWPQVKNTAPKLHAMALAASRAAALEAGVRTFFSHVGKAFKKPAAAVLLAQVPVSSAAALADTKPSYVYNARAPKYQADVYVQLDILIIWMIRLAICLLRTTAVAVLGSSIHFIRCSTLRAPHGPSCPLEREATIAHMMEALGAKSGQTTEGERFRYDQKDVVYHELYQDRYCFQRVFCSSPCRPHTARRNTHSSRISCIY